MQAGVLVPAAVFTDERLASQSTDGDDVDPACLNVVQRDVRTLFRRHGSPAQYRRYYDHIAVAEERVAEDLTALSRQDPAAGRSWEYVANSYASYQAVQAYRLAHALLRADAAEPRRERPSAALARRISEDAKICTGIEIHPAATIGRRFVLDHAAGTVIGESAELGDDCYVLQGVILGATGIATNPAGKRHPTVGDRVQIGAFARLFGPITVGSDTRIGPHSVVVTDIPAGSHVRLVNQCQVRSPRTTLEIFGVVPLGSGWFEIHGDGLDLVDVRVVDADDAESDSYPVQIIERATNRLTCRIDESVIVPAHAVLRVAEPSGERVLITQLGSVWRSMRRAALRFAGR